jgi:hypothetical protein
MTTLHSWRLLPEGEPMHSSAPRNTGTSLDQDWVLAAHMNRSAVDRVGYPKL